MSIFRKKKKYIADIEELPSSYREDEIIRLELARLKVEREIEDTLRKYAKLCGKRIVPKRRYKIGRAPNDWNTRKYREYFGKTAK